MAESPTGYPYPEKSPLDQKVGEYSRDLLNVLKGFTGGGIRSPNAGTYRPETRAEEFGQFLQLPLSLGMAAAPGRGGSPENTARLNRLALEAKAGSQAARDELVQSLNGLLWSVANRYGRAARTGGVKGQPGIKTVEPQVNAQDLYNRGVVQLLDTIGNYREGPKGFMGYAYPGIVRTMRAEANQARTPIAISPEIMAAMRKLDAAHQRLLTQHGPIDFTPQQILDEANRLNPKAVKPDIAARVVSGRIESLPQSRSLEGTIGQSGPATVHGGPGEEGGDVGGVLDRALKNLDPSTSRYMSPQQNIGATIEGREFVGALRDLYRTLPTEMKPFIQQAEQGLSAKAGAEQMGIPLRTYQRRMKEAQDFWKGMVEIHQKQQANPPIRPIAGGSDAPQVTSTELNKVPGRATYRGFQEGFGKVPGFHLYDLVEDLRDPKTGAVIHPKGSTVSQKTLDQFGIPYEDAVPFGYENKPLRNIAGGSTNDEPSKFGWPASALNPKLERLSDRMSRSGGYRPANKGQIGVNYQIPPEHALDNLLTDKVPQYTGISGPIMGRSIHDDPGAAKEFALNVGVNLAPRQDVSASQKALDLLKSLFPHLPFASEQPTQTSTNPPTRWQSNMLNKANDRIDRLNATNAQWGMPPIPYESNMASLAPRSGKAPAGTNFPMGMSNLKDAKAQLQSQREIQDLLAGGQGDVNYWSLNDQGLIGHGTPKWNKAKGWVKPNDPTQTRDIYGNFDFR